MCGIGAVLTGKIYIPNIFIEVRYLGHGWISCFQSSSLTTVSLKPFHLGFIHPETTPPFPTTTCRKRNKPCRGTLFGSFDFLSPTIPQNK